jgi:hypothetical protein
MLVEEVEVILPLHKLGTQNGAALLVLTAIISCQQMLGLQFLGAQEGAAVAVFKVQIQR